MVQTRCVKFVILLATFQFLSRATLHFDLTKISSEILFFYSNRKMKWKVKWKFLKRIGAKADLHEVRRSFENAC